MISTVCRTQTQKDWNTLLDKVRQYKKMGWLNIVVSIRYTQLRHNEATAKYTSLLARLDHICDQPASCQPLLRLESLSQAYPFQNVQLDLHWQTTNSEVTASYLSITGTPTRSLVVIWSASADHRLERCGWSLSAKQPRLCGLRHERTQNA